MSVGRFVLSRYERVNGDVHPIRVQPETITAWNPAPAGATTSDIRAKVSGTSREIGLTARKVRISFGANPPGDYAPFSSISLPVLTPAAFAALEEGDVVQYQGTSATVLGKSPGRPLES